MGLEHQISILEWFLKDHVTLKTGAMAVFQVKYIKTENSYLKWQYSQYQINAVLSPIRTVIVSQGDVSDFHHLQGVVGDFNAVRIQDVGVFLSPPL